MRALVLLLALTACHRQEAPALAPPYGHFLAHDSQGSVARFYDEDMGVVCYRAWSPEGVSLACVKMLVELQ